MTERKNIYDKLGFDPHVYEVSALAYRGLATTGQDQTILVTGESGAGKTETVKIVMDHLATVQQTRPEGVPSEHSAAAEIVARVCKSSPVFEAFGNAKTVRNDNSSRFGKFIQLQFEVEPMAVAELAGRAVPFTDLVGSNCTTYLLEKNRVVFHAEGERTFHIFYQLLGAPKEFKENIGSFWADATGHDFCYTAGHGCNNAEDAEAWQETVEALEVFKFQGDSLRVLMESLAIVLQLGNLVFDHDPSDFEEHNTIIKNKEELQRLSELSGIDSKDIEETMTSRVLKTPGSDDIKVKLSPQVAKESCDALAKEIYSRIFGLMVRRINEYTACPEPRRLGAKGFGHISLLDIFGFERFDVNRFEQLCINYTNERLHNKYVVDNFNQIKDEYHTEGVDLYDFKLVDNSEILDLLEGNPGLIISLNEECFLPKGNSESFVYKVKSTHSESKRLIDKKLHRKTEFGIDHFTGPVEYEAMNFVERNMDKLPDGLLECAAKSTNSFIQEEFKIMLSTRGLDGLDEGKGSFKKKKSSNKTVLQKFQTQLKSLMSVMEGTRTRYIRCIKPNTAMAPKLTNHNSTMQQLECSGLMTALIISRESFPTKLPYEFIMSRYSCLMMEKDFKYIGKMDLKSKVNHILSKWLKPLSKKCRGGTRTMPFACGKTKVFFKAGAQDRLEELRMEYFERAALTVQTWARKHGAMQMLTRAKKSACKMQSLYRMVKERVRFQQTKRAATFIAALGRRILAVAHFVMAKRSACKLQSFSRMVVARAQLQRQRRAATVLAAWIRGRFAVAQLVSAVRSARKLQSFSRMVVARAQFQHQKWAQTVMAAWIRGRWAVALLVQMRKERAATLIQSYCRSRPARQELSRKLDAMAVIQRAARSRASAVTESEKDTKIADVSSEARVVGSKTKVVQTGVRDEASVELNAGIKE